MGQNIEIPFQGSGWVFLGEEKNQQGISYSSRRIVNGGQNFIFKTERTGSYALKFYRQDFIEDYIINEIIQVIVSEAPAQPSVTSVTPPAQEQAPQNVPPAVVAVEPVDYFQRAQQAYTAGMFPEAISFLNQIPEQNITAESDEILWLYGQSFEANSPSRNIRSAINYYRRLLQEYPQSRFGSDAQRRIAYLERFYLNIR